MMDKSCHSSGEESSAINPNLDSTTTTTTAKDHYLKHLHKLSHKISKPPIRKPFEFDHPPPPPPPLDHANESQPSNLHHHHHQQQQQQQQHQPPVYNVSKSDFRDVVQKLTGSPAHDRFTNNPPVQPVKPQSSRLQRIRPPPLEHVGNRPPGAAAVAGGGGLNPSFRPGHVSGSFFNAVQRQHHQPLSPLPPLPAVHATAESPISAYMRCFQTTTAGATASPRWNSFAPPPPAQMNAAVQPTPATEFPAPSSPLPFGCLHSPKSPGFPFSPGNQFGFQQLTPLSPTPPAPSPRWKSL